MKLFEKVIFVILFGLLSYSIIGISWSDYKFNRDIQQLYMERNVKLDSINQERMDELDNTMLELEKMHKEINSY